MNQPEKRNQPRPQRPAPKSRSLFLPLFLLGIFLILVAGIAFFAFFAMSFRPNKPVKVASKSVLHLQVMGLIPEYVPQNPIDIVLDKRPIVFLDLLHMVNTARRDDRIEGILLNVGPSNLSWAQLQELRGAIKEFRNSGKWVLAEGEIWQEKEYYLASVANEVYMVPEGILVLDGLMSRTTFYADAFRKLGIRVHVEAIGEFKSFADAYTRTEMSEAHRLSTETLLESIQDQMAIEVSESREVDANLINQTLAESLYELPKATSLGLIDGVAYPHDVQKNIAAKVGLKSTQKIRFISGPDYLISRPQFGGGGPDKIALIYAVGTIQSGSGQQGLFGGNAIGSDSFVRTIRQARQNPRVKAIVLRIDSPGGSSLASDVMWREIQRTKEMGIPVIASMGGAAASGGYYMAMACNKIVAEPTTITGSIGVVSMRIDFEKLYEEFLLHVGVVKTGQSADFFDPHRALTEKEIESFHHRALAAYKSFVTKAAESRGMEYSELEEKARGRVWSGVDAKNQGLVDHLGGLYEAFILAAKEAELKDYGVIRYPEDEDFWTLVRENQFASARKESKAFETLSKLVPKEMKAIIDIGASQGNLPVQTMAISPFSLEID